MLAVIRTAVVAVVLAVASTVSANPVNWTPQVSVAYPKTVYDMVQVGNVMYAGGLFSTVTDATNGVVHSRQNFFSFDATTGAVTTLNVPANGQIQAVEKSPDGASVYIGGSFTTIGGVAMPGLARFVTATHKIDPTFKAGLNGAVGDIVYVNNRLIVAGAFTRKIRALNPLTGGDTGMIPDLSISGQEDPNDATKVRRIAVNPSGTQLVGVGNFTSVGHAKRIDILKLDLPSVSSGLAVLDPWHAPLFDRSCPKLFGPHGVAFSPNGQFFAVANTGGPALSGYCDSVVRFESADRSSTSTATWVNSTGSDSVYNVAVSAGAVYAGGHFRWLNNKPAADDCTAPGCVSRAGIGAIDPVTGKALSWNPGKDRGHGVEKLLLTPAGLWVGSDGVYVAGEKHPGIAMFPVS